ncbi:vesicular-fusion protein SEC18 [Flagelloscypha sp. PMI_526]|nr:vesicular-fusion protein SEC18 [Flagelloscypha sp. PMI_526]
MSWNRNPPPSQGGYNSLPTGPRPGGRQPQNAYGDQYNSPGYNDPSAALFEKRTASPGGARMPPARSSAAGGYASGGRGGNYDVVIAPTDDFVYNNCIAVSSSDFRDGEYILIKGQYAFTARTSPQMQPGTIGASQPQRTWAQLSRTGDNVTVTSIPPNELDYIETVTLEIGFAKKGVLVQEQYSVDDLSKLFLRLYTGLVFSEGQTMVFEYHGNNILAKFKGLTTVQLAEEQRAGRRSSNPKDRGLLFEKSEVLFTKAPDSDIKLKGSATKAAPNAILQSNFKFEDMGIGGLDTEFSEIFRRAFASRVFPPGLVEKLGINHVKGILLHGPPGTGKTLIARQIGKMLNAREPKIVNGPEILSKFVGQSEENIRKLFEEAEKEYKEKKEESGLHIIIFDELDAIFKQRGSTSGGTGVGDTVVNQLLSKMDGVDQLNNILIIGMTNRKDMIDEALLRPGRLEVHMEISLPDEHGRYQILNIHTANMKKNGVLDDNVNIREIASQTKNFSGAELNGLVKSAASFAFSRHVKVDIFTNISKPSGLWPGISDDVENLRVNRDDFQSALNDVKPAFGVAEEELAQLIQNQIIEFNDTVREIKKAGELFVKQVKDSDKTPLVTVLFHGPAGAGKTALAAEIASKSEFPFIKLITPENMVGFGELQKVQAITKVFTDSYKSPLSVLVVDNIERLIEWTPMGARFSNAVLQTLLVLFTRKPPKGRRLLILATTSIAPILKDLGFGQQFDTNLRVPPISDVASINEVLKETQFFESNTVRREFLPKLIRSGFTATKNVGIKKLLGMIEMARQEPRQAEHRLHAALNMVGDDVF